MAISCEPAALVADAKCFCGIPEKTKLDVLLVLLARIAEVSINPNDLMNAAKCVCIPPGMQMNVAISLLCQIFNQGGVAQVCILGGVGPPNMPVPCNFSAYVELPGPNKGLWLGDTAGSNNWDCVITQGP